MVHRRPDVTIIQRTLVPILFMLHMLLIHGSIWFRIKTGNFEGVGNIDNMPADIKIST